VRAIPGKNIDVIDAIVEINLEGNNNCTIIIVKNFKEVKDNSSRIREE